MRFVFIGTGSAFTTGSNFNSNMYFECDSGNRLLIDCGSDARHALHELGLDNRSFSSIYISHLHADHIGGLEWLSFCNIFDHEIKDLPTLYCHESMVKFLWKALSSGLCSLENKEASLSTFFNVHAIPDNGSFTWEHLEFSIYKNDHQISNHEDMPCYGLQTTINGVKILLSTDTKFPHREDHPLRERYKNTDIIFHDCETSINRSYVHAHYSELITLPQEIKNKMWLYHYQPGNLPDAKKDGFLGFVKKGQVFEF